MIESPVSDLTSIPNSLPVNALDVIVRFWGKLIAPALAATLQHFLAITGCHSRAETMHTQTTTNFWLISSFSRHHNSFQKSAGAA
jgi:hypothetical protein